MKRSSIPSRPSAPDLLESSDEDEPTSPRSAKAPGRSPSGSRLKSLDAKGRAKGHDKVPAYGRLKGLPGAWANKAARATRALLKHWFLLGTGLSIVWAQVWPWLGADGGPLWPEVTVKYGAVVSIFFISGLTMRTETMLGTIKDWRQHAFIQGARILSKSTPHSHYICSFFFSHNHTQP